MKIIDQSVEIIQPKDMSDLYTSIELAGRTCYQSAMAGTFNEQKQFIQNLIKKGHESVLEHETISVEWITDRAVLAEITRHRLASYSVESQRYVTYDKPDNFKVIKPVGFLKWPPEHKKYWETTMEQISKRYSYLIDAGYTPQVARSVLPQAFATKIRMTANIREWRHILKLRTSKAAHPQIRDIAIKTLDKFMEEYYSLFEDISGV